MPAAAVVATVAVSAYTANKQAKAAKAAGNMQASAADRAAQLQADAAKRDAQMQWDMFNQARADNEPFRQAGLTGLQGYMELLGLPTSGVTGAIQASTQAAAQPRAPSDWFGAGNAPTVNAQLYASDAAYRRAWDELDSEHRARFNSGYTVQSDRDAIQNELSRRWQQYTPAQSPAATGTQQGAATPSLTQEQAFERFRNTPGYQFGLTEGVRALDSSAAASGGLFSGKAAKALTAFGQNYADQKGYQPYKNDLAALAGLGPAATNQNNALGQNYASSIGNAWQNAATAKAGGITDAATARSSGLLGKSGAWGDFAGGLTGLAGLYAGGKWNGSTPNLWDRWGGV